MNYSKKVMAMEPSPIRDMMVRAAELEDVISFAVGEPDFLPAPNIIETAKKALDSGVTRYTPGAGLEELRAEYAKYLSDAIKVPYKKEEVIVTAGGMSAIFLGLSTILDEGDEVLISDPYWTNYAQQIILSGGIPVSVNVFEENNFVITPEEIKKVITPGTKAILINSPSNPTGGVIDDRALQEIADIAIEKDIFLISDEVYRHILFDNKKYISITSLEGLKERTLIIDSCSKSYAMTGFRVGFAAGPKEWIDQMIKITEDVYSCVSGFSQMAAIEAFRSGSENREIMLREYEKRRNYIYNRIKGMDKISCIKPQGAFYVFVNIKNTGLSSKEFCNRLLEEQHVAVVPGDNFGKNAEGYVRISYATSMENIKNGLQRMENFLNSL